jgi:hypothetical protein
LRKIPWIDTLACLSLGNLSFLQVWNGLLFYNREQSFFLHRLPFVTQYLAASLGVILLGAVFFALLKCARWIRRRWGSLFVTPLLFLMILLPANVARNVISDNYADLRVRLIAALGLKGIIFIFAIGLFGFVYLLAHIGGRAARIALVILAQLSILFPLEIGESIRRLKNARPADYADGPLAAMQPVASPRPRVVWIIFDELDYRLLFPDRPSSVLMPEFDKLREQSLNATDAMSPARDTSVSVPSLLTGRQFVATKGYGPATLYARQSAPSEMQPIDLNSTIFSDVRQRGGNVAVVGWYLPYCRMFSASLSACSWYDNGNVLNITGDGVDQNLLYQTRGLFETSLFSPFGQTLTLKHAIRMVQNFRRDALLVAANPAFDLVFLHYPVPHAPHPYDRFNGTFSRTNAGFEGYSDSLALTDILLGELRAEMTRAHLWDDATILATSDHPYRESTHFDGKADPRVPFLLKFPNQNNSVAYDRPLHTIATRDLLNSIFRSEVSSPEAAIEWFSCGAAPCAASGPIRPAAHP